jgi:penicillin-binding protein 2
MLTIMLKRLRRRIWSKGKINTQEEIDPDEIFLDSSNLPSFNTYQFEGRIEKPIERSTFFFAGVIFLVVGIIFTGRLWILQINQGEAFEVRSENNRLSHTTIFADRGLILDRNKVVLAGNSLNPLGDFAKRSYIDSPGFSHVVGYVKYPSQDKFGIYYEKEFVPQDGVEEYYNTELLGANGLKITETDALGEIQSESLLTPPVDGENLTLSIDSRVQSKFYELIESTAIERGFSGGAGVIMNVLNGEVLALTSYPEYSANVMTDGTDVAAINGFLNAKSNPFLNRAVSGLYIPGSIVKPFIATGVLTEGVVDPSKQILSTGSITVPNPYDPTKKTIFKDWKAHGWVDLRGAISVSSNVYFFSVGGGYDGQKGIGISNIEKYMRMFGFGDISNIDLAGEGKGNVPSPAWKAENFEDDDWRIGDTYNSSIGQYGFQVTPIQVVRGIAALANGGTLLAPSLLANNPLPVRNAERLPINPSHLEIVREGMRQSVTDGTAKGLSMPGISVAAKTGTAELGVSKQDVNSWVTGFFPYENPKYAFAVIMERGDVHNQIGATFVMRQLFEWMYVETPEHVK